MPVVRKRRHEACLIEGCSNKGRGENYYIQGLCSTHYQRLRRNGDATKLVYGKHKGKKCITADCQMRARSKGRCSRHYSYERRGMPYGYLIQTYHRMLSRVRGTHYYSKKYPQLWQGKEILPQDEFIRWGLSDPQFQFLFRRWIESGRDEKIAPSIDRINSEFGYTVGNIQWLAKGVNTKKAILVRTANQQSKRGKKVA